MAMGEAKSRTKTDPDPDADVDVQAPPDPDADEGAHPDPDSHPHPDVVAADDDGDAFVGYNEWAKRSLQVTLCTDLVYDTPGIDPDDEGGLGDERGVFIAEDIAPQTQVLRIPFDSLLTLQWIVRQSKHAVYGNVAAFRALHDPEAVWRAAVDQTEDELLAMVLMYERWIAMEASSWAPHLNVLPTEYHNLLYFSETEIARLVGTEMDAMARHMQLKVHADYERLHRTVISEIGKVLQEQGVDRDVVASAFSEEHYVWAISTIWSRFVSISVGNVNTNVGNDVIPNTTTETHRLKAMAPVFDMLNHDPASEMSHFFDTESKTFQLVSYQHWSAGSQLCINYGALSNHKLLALYGFVLPENPDNSIEIYMPMDASTTPMFDAKAKLLADNGLEHDVTPFELVEDEVNDLLLIAVRIEELDEPDMSIEAFQKAASSILEGNVWNARNEVATLTRIVYLLQKMLEALDEQTLQDGAVLERSPSLHETMAFELREGDKKLLTENIDMLRWRLLEYLPQIESN